jgi:phosphate transport system substrate-binding protein
MYNLRTGNVPDNFTLRILPFFLPLFYTLLITAVTFYFMPLSEEVLGGFMIFGLPHYFVYTVLALFGITIGGGLSELIPLLPCGLAFFVAVWGAIYVSKKSALVPQRQALTLMFGITLFLCGTIVCTYSHFRTEILFPLWQDTSIVQDERRRHSFHRDETDLSDYQPFSENNKLVKIESPTLAIDSEHPKLHGALALYPVYAAAVEAIYQDVDIEKLDNRQWDAIVKGGTSPQAFNFLIAGRSDMLFMLQPSAKQLHEAEEKGIKLTITPMGHEAFVFFVSKTNPVDDLTVEQIREIYSKKITRWNEVGGKNERIMPFQRPEGSGSQTMMLKVMGEVPLAKPQKEEFQISMGGIVNRVADYRNYGNSIGFSFRYYVEGMFKHDGVKLLKVNGIEPTAANIQSGKYPLIGEIVIITAGSENPNVQKLTDWFLSPQGQELIEKVGYVPLGKLTTEHSE